MVQRVPDEVLDRVVVFYFVWFSPQTHLLTALEHGTQPHIRSVLVRSVARDLTLRNWLRVIAGAGRLRRDLLEEQQVVDDLRMRRGRARAGSFQVRDPLARPTRRGRDNRRKLASELRSRAVPSG